MKPMHLVVAVAVIAVGVVLYMMRDGDGEHTGRRDANSRNTPRTEDRSKDATEKAELQGKAKVTVGQGLLSLSATVIGLDGEPAANAKLTLDGAARVEITTDGDGRAVIEELASGFYVVLARKGDATAAKTVELDRSKDLGELRLTESVRVRGFVYDERNKPIAKATVEAVTQPASRGFDLNTIARLLTEPGQVAASARTGEDGAYELLVRKGEIVALRAFAPNRAQEGDAARTYTEGVEGVNFYLFPGVALDGRVVSPDDRPVPGARVMLLDPSMIFGRGVPKIEATTNTDGSFSISTMPQDQSMLVVRAPGFASFMEGDVKLPQHDKRIQLENGIAVTLRTVREGQEQLPAPSVNVAVMYHGNFAVGVSGTDGRLTVPNLPAKTSGGMGNQSQAMFWGGGFVAHQVSLREREPTDGVIDLGDVPLKRGGVVRGKVVDAVTGEPIAGASLRALGGVPQDLGMLGVTRASSGADGTFELVGVPLKATLLLAHHPDYQLNENPMTLMMRNRGGGGGGKPLFPEGEDELETVVSLKPAANVTGIVQAPDGTPVAGAEIMIRDQMMMMSAMMLGNGPAAAKSDAEGRFELSGLTPGQAVPIIASHREWGSSRAKRATAGTPVVLELSAPLVLQGVVNDERGEPIPGVRVSVVRAGEERTRGRMNPFATATTTRPGITDEKGAWVVRNAPVGDLEVTFSHTRYTEQTKSVTVNASKQAEDLGKTVLARGHGIEGIVLGADGEPLQGVRLNARHTSGTQDQSPGRTWGDARTDDKGRFEIYGLREGEFAIDPRAGGLYGKTVQARTGTTDVRIEMQRAGRLVGVAMGDDGSPVAGAHVNAQIQQPSQPGNTNWNSVAWAQTDPAGRFTLDALPPATTFRLQIRHDGYKTFEIDAQAVESEQRYTLATGNRLEGFAIDENRNPVPNASVRIMKPDGNFLKQVNTDAGGRFRAGGLGEGPFRVQLVSGQQNYIQTEPIEVVAGARDIELIARQGEMIGGRIVGPDGKPRNQLQVVALDGTNQRGQEWVWQDDGRFTIRGLKKGVYTLRVARYVENEQPKMVSVEGVATGTTDVEITVPD